MRLLIGARIRSQRKQAGISQASLAQKVGISASYLNLIENDKRPVAGKLLSDLAQALDIKTDKLSRGVTTDMIERLQQTARQFSDPEHKKQEELESLEGFITHFPEWARLLDNHITSHEDLEKVTELLSDRMAHDPILADSLHIMLSNITAIRSTAELLTLQGSMPEAQRTRFTQNIFQESKRLSVAAEKLLGHFDSKSFLEQPAKSATQNITAHNSGKKAAKKTDQNQHRTMIELPESLSGDSSYQKAAEIITSQSLHASYAHHQFHPLNIADYYGLPARAVFYHLISLEDKDLPVFGLLEIDNAAGVIFRKETAQFRLPSRSGACPRWPIYRALSTPSYPVMMQMQLNSGEIFSATALAQQAERDHSQLAPVSRSIMIFHQISTAQSKREYGPLLDVGFHCSVCARTQCQDRRETYALIAEANE